ncbi:MAG: hypothetical protein UT24_C0026G0001 [Candidatus Woesebacteria bacterium GW2011_GWB1_39_12]|uniref:DUF5655 domain-containing protein n=1 Tax=Candidatus Woesebacteria bacterium GW2011_GWB1_39_12 TaxID=1618574 RepID=A0A0G0MFR2_9BACT|nr:MAG: hypothetical protein UT24_C0026G0001 [Candidatus Woesebacteria bacterium GW2011_GWB1_39_12]
MAIFRISGTKLGGVKELRFESYFDKEKKLQNLTETNLDTLFGLEFVSTEFNLETFWLDTLAFNPVTKSFVIIEYKKVENFTLMDQGQTYLNLILDHKADILLEYMEKTGKTLKKNDVDWSQTRVMFIGPKFNTYQKRALSPNLPFELWEVAIYEGGLIEYDEITPVGAERRAEKKPSILTGTAAKEIKTYTLEDHLTKATEEIKDLFQKTREQILLLDPQIKEKAVSWYIGYQLKGYNIVTLQIYSADKLMLNLSVEHPFDPEKRLKPAPKSWQGWSKIPLSRFELRREEDIPYIMKIIKQSYEFRKK